MTETLNQQFMRKQLLGNHSYVPCSQCKRLTSNKLGKHIICVECLEYHESRKQMSLLW